MLGIIENIKHVIRGVFLDWDLNQVLCLFFDFLKVNSSLWWPFFPALRFVISTIVQLPWFNKYFQLYDVDKYAYDVDKCNKQMSWSTENN